MNRIEEIAQGLREFVEKTGFKKVVLGLSGGVDSALVAKLAVMALGKGNVTGILMPNEGLSSDHSVSDAKAWAEELGIKYHIIPINPFIDHYQALPWKETEQAHMNIQARIRATILYHYANSHQALVVGTGNKTELTLGYFTKFGDGAADILPIGNLYKTEAWKMAKELSLPEAIIQKAPSAELRENHTDEQEIGMPYEEIDEILKKFEVGEKAKTENEKKMEARITSNAHKNQMPTII